MTTEGLPDVAIAAVTTTSVDPSSRGSHAGGATTRLADSAGTRSSAPSSRRASDSGGVRKRLMESGDASQQTLQQQQRGGGLPKHELSAEFKEVREATGFHKAVVARGAILEAACRRLRHACRRAVGRTGSSRVCAAIFGALCFRMRSLS